ncbi:hypothetical protein MSG28_011044 [Choristoneura fumiferana]|uniref:Uncharacterized protein n=1 Tax=Choristoneura fumiferana TaxID=7141 RepID=A0ACC0KQ55_CHOFU|nr:hypothetical protein MSG28_011044 [Choristoneura fumiferana]
MGDTLSRPDNTNMEIPTLFFVYTPMETDSSTDADQQAQPEKLEIKRKQWMSSQFSKDNGTLRLCRVSPPASSEMRLRGEAQSTLWVFGSGLHQPKSRTQPSGGVALACGNGSRQRTTVVSLRRKRNMLKNLGDTVVGPCVRSARIATTILLANPAVKQQCLHCCVSAWRITTNHLEIIVGVQRCSSEKSTIETETDILTLPSLYVIEIIMYVRKNICDFPINVDKPKATSGSKEMFTPGYWCPMAIGLKFLNRLQYLKVMMD